MPTVGVASLFKGETAIGKQGWASLNRLQYSPVQEHTVYVDTSFLFV